MASKLPQSRVPPPGGIGITKESIEKVLGHEVDEIYVTIAKNSVLGIEEDVIAQILGAPVEDVKELMESQEYKDVRLVVGTKQADSLAGRDLSWDAIETEALRRLAGRVSLESDTEMLLKIAAVANKAQRRTAPQSNVLEPGRAGSHVSVTLSQKFVEKITLDGTIERTESRQIRTGSPAADTNPSFTDIDELLKVSSAMQDVAPKFNPMRKIRLNQELNDDESF